MNRNKQWERLKALSDQDAHGVLCRLWGYLGQAEHIGRDEQSAKELLDTLSRWVEQQHGLVQGRERRS